jgi:hypothetical protein
MTKTKFRNSGESDKQEIYTGFCNPRYTATVIDVGSGAALTSDMLTKAAEKARTMDFGNYQGIMSPKAMEWFVKDQEERKQLEKFKSTPVGKALYE